MVTAKWCCENINSGRIRAVDILGEVKELLMARCREEIQEELGDILYFIYCWLYSKFGIDLPMHGAMESVEKFITRLEIWKMIFLDHNLTFHPKYLVNGSNYRKVEKINMALELARREQYLTDIS